VDTERHKRQLKEKEEPVNELARREYE
jgi:hypothetical protein